MKNFRLSSITNCNLFCQAIGKIKHQKDADNTNNLNSIPDGMNQPLVVRFESYIKSDGNWTAADKMKLQRMVNDKMLRKCEEWNYFQKAKEKTFEQIKLLIQQKLEVWKIQNITIVIEE